MTEPMEQYCRLWKKQNSWADRRQVSELEADVIKQTIEESDVLRRVAEQYGEVEWLS